MFLVGSSVVWCLVVGDDKNFKLPYHLCKTKPSVELRMSEVNTSTCRFYEQKYPEIDDPVMVNVKEIADMGAYVKLLEYDEIEGMILLSELSRRRIRSIQKLVKVGRNEIAVVLRVDKDKGYIDLSKKRVTPEEARKCEERYNMSKAVHSILRHVAEKYQVSLEGLYQRYAWPLARKYGHAFIGFRHVITDPKQAFEGVENIDFEDEIYQELVNQASKKLTPNPVKVRADVDINCFAYEGIDAIKDALRAGEAVSTENVPVKVKLVAVPLFVLTSLSLDREKAVAALNESIEKMREAIVARGGSLTVKMPPKAVNENDEAELAKLMERSERENAQVDGDDDDSEVDSDDE